MKVRFTPTALYELDEIARWLAARNPVAARKFDERIDEVLETLVMFPESGSLTEDPLVRRALTRPFSYVIYYQVLGDELVVLDIRHGRRRPALPQH